MMIRKRQALESCTSFRYAERACASRFEVAARTADCTVALTIGGAMACLSEEFMLNSILYERVSIYKQTDINVYAAQCSH